MAETEPCHYFNCSHSMVARCCDDLSSETKALLDPNLVQCTALQEGQRPVCDLLLYVTSVTRLTLTSN